MGKNAYGTHIDGFYSKIKYFAQINNRAQIQSCLDKIEHIEYDFIQTYIKRKKEGGYYTTDNITRFIITEVLISFINNRFDFPKISTLKELQKLSSENKQKITSLLSNLTVCDPSCGSGAFLINAIKILTDLLEKLGETLNEFESAQNVLENLYGYDINENAIKLCRLKLFKWFFIRNTNDFNLKSVFQLIENNIQISDTLTRPISQKFDIIIGNPPYGNILDDYQKSILIKKGIFHKEIYCAFLLKALEWSDGVIGLLVPKSFLLRQTYIRFRNLLLQKANLLRIYDIGPNIFKAATNEVQILIYERKKRLIKNLEVYNQSGLKINTYSNQKFDLLKFCTNPNCSLNDRIKKIYVFSFNDYCPYCNLKNEPMNRIRIKVTTALLSIIDKIEQKGNLNYLNINDFPKMIRGEEDKGLKAVKHNIKANIKGSCSFLNAKNDLMSYHYRTNKFFDIEKIDPKILKGNNYEYYIKPKLLIKHNNTYPVAVYTEQCVCFTSSIYSLLHEDKTELKYLCTLLNSSLFKFYCIYGINNQINTTINLNQYMIRHLPILEIHDELKSTLAKWVDSINNLYKHPHKNKRQILELYEKIDNIIFHIYLITNGEKQLIFKYI